MRTYDLIQEVAALGGYQADNSVQAQVVINKARALRRLNYIKNEISSRFGGRWQNNYREGNIPLVPLNVTGTVTFTNGSRTVTGAGTTWTGITNPKFCIIIGGDGAFYRITSVTGNTQLIIDQPYQGVTQAGVAVRIWQDIYALPPDVFDVADFLNFQMPGQLDEMWSKYMRSMFPAESASQIPDFYELFGRLPATAVYSTGTVSGTAGTYVLTGAGTSWLANLQPGYRITIGGAYYHVYSVDSDTQVTLYQMLTSAIAALTTYTAVGRNSLLVRFRAPAAQQVLNYSYYRKDYPAVNDDDEDWILEMYPHVMIHGIVRQDAMDKKVDPFWMKAANVDFEDSMKNMLVAEQASHHGSTAVGYDIPASARE